MTSMASKVVRGSKELLTNIAVEATTRIADEIDGKTLVDFDNIKIQKNHGGSI
jgi:chaperonin GroEL (HSP60 family)